MLRRAPRRFPTSYGWCNRWHHLPMRSCSLQKPPAWRYSILGHLCPPPCRLRRSRAVVPNERQEPRREASVGAGGLWREKHARNGASNLGTFQMSFRVSSRLDDIYLDETFDTDWAALERATAWTKAGLPGVTITHGAQEFTVDQFARRINNSPEERPV
jgi:hypothetical protein